MKNYLNKRGFTLLFAVLVTSLLLAIAFSIISISTKQTIITSYGRESQVAFYAADSGAECARYWDLKGNVFAKNSAISRISCAGNNNIEIKNVSDNNAYSCTTGAGDCVKRDLSFDLINTTGAAPAHVNITIEKNISTNETQIRSYGQNTNNPNDPRRVERAVELIYTPSLCGPSTFSAITSSAQQHINIDPNGAGGYDGDIIVNGQSVYPTVARLWAPYYNVDLVTTGNQNSQKNYGQWQVSSALTPPPLLSVTFATSSGQGTNVFGYYPVGNPNNFVPILCADPDKTGRCANVGLTPVTPGNSTRTFQVSDPTTPIAFAIYTIDYKYFRSTIASDNGIGDLGNIGPQLNSSGNPITETLHVPNFQDTDNNYYLSNEDGNDFVVGQNDHDYNEMMVIVGIAGCR